MNMKTFRINKRQCESTPRNLINYLLYLEVTIAYRYGSTITNQIG